MVLIISIYAAESLEDALKQLYLIDAIDENGAITSVGRTMSGMFYCFSAVVSLFSNFFSLSFLSN